jgi:hypothetical protein
MPIRPYLDDHTFDPETVRLLGLAFEITRAALNIEERNEPAKEIIASKLIELVKQGERDPTRLSEQVLAWVREASADENYQRRSRRRKVDDASRRY